MVCEEYQHLPNYDASTGKQFNFYFFFCKDYDTNANLIQFIILNKNNTLHNNSIFLKTDLFFPGTFQHQYGFRLRWRSIEY